MAVFIPVCRQRWCALARSSFDRLETANVGSVIKIDWASLDLPDSTVIELVEMLNDYSMLVFKDGRWRKTSMLSTRTS